MSTTSKDAQKMAAAMSALPYIVDGAVLGVGSGSTVNAFISLLRPFRGRVTGAVAASTMSERALRDVGIEILDLNDVEHIPIYVDGADEIDPSFALIKGGGAALTREKVIASAAGKFVCLVDASKQVAKLGTFPLPVEVVPLATNFVIRRMAQLGGRATVRTGVVTDNGNQVLDVVGLPFGGLTEALALETEINQIPGVLCNGIFAQRRADICICAGPSGTAVQERGL